ncbi:MAG: YciI family protein [Deltaproteobacteria bacterium]|nr:YciI family protein [Deltaproteobacteria bacterium]
MQYMLLIYSNEKPENPPAPEEWGKVMSEYMKFTEAIKSEGIMIAGDALKGTDTATTVRVRDGDAMHTDGPFAETKEALGGYYLIDVPDLDAALAVAARLPGSWYGSVEVRPVMMPEDYQSA